MTVKSSLLVQANEKSDLLQKLGKTDINVPPRRCRKRTSEHTERYCVRKLLHFLACSDRLTYPLEVWHQDRPDFILKMPGTCTGIEHTEVTPNNEVKKDLLRKGERDWHFVETHRPGDERKTAKQLKEELNHDPHNESSPGWVGNECEEDWAEWMAYAITRKQEKFDHYQKFDKTWLLIYGNLSVPILKVREALNFLPNSIHTQGMILNYDEVWIIEEPHLCRLHGTAAGEVFALPAS